MVYTEMLSPCLQWEELQWAHSHDWPRIWETQRLPFEPTVEVKRPLWLELLMFGKEQNCVLLPSGSVELPLTTRQRPVFPRVQMRTLWAGVCLQSPYKRHHQWDSWVLKEHDGRALLEGRGRAVQPHREEAGYSPADNPWEIHKSTHETKN